MPETRFYLGVDLGGTKTAVTLWRHSQDVAQDVPLLLAKRLWSTLPDGPNANIARIVSEGQSLLSSADAVDLAAVGISGGGPVEAASGTIRFIPNLSGWENTPIAQPLEAAFGVPAHLENDAKASALAEWLYGAGRGTNNLAFLTCSTGIGAGLIVDGVLLRGHAHLAGELGHLEIVRDGRPCGCGRRGCLEAYASGAGIAGRLAQLRHSDPSLPADAKEVVERAAAGDTFGREFLRETAGYLAIGLAQLIFCVNPERIVLGTIVVGAGDLILQPLRELVAERVWPSLLDGLTILPAGLGIELGDYAALAVASRAG